MKKFMEIQNNIPVFVYFLWNFWKWFDWSENSWKSIKCNFNFFLFWSSFWFLFLTFPFEKKYEKITVGLSFSLFRDYNFVLFLSYVLIHCENSCEYMLILAFFLMWNILFQVQKIHKKLFWFSFITFTLLLLTCLLSVQGTLRKLSCFACFVFHFICGTRLHYQCDLFSLISMSPSLSFLYALFALCYLAGTLYGCVQYTPSVIYFHTGAFMLMSDALISDLFPLWC